MRLVIGGLFVMAISVGCGGGGAAATKGSGGTPANGGNAGANQSAGNAGAGGSAGNAGGSGGGTTAGGAGATAKGGNAGSPAGGSAGAASQGGGSGFPGGGSAGATNGGGGTASSGSSGMAGAAGASSGNGGTAGVGGSGPGPASSCSEGTLFAGDPRFDGNGTSWNPNGQGLLADPPLRFRDMEINGSRFLVETQYELWSADTSAASPSISRFAGDEDDDTPRFEADLPCAQTRFLVIDGIASRADGTLVVADSRGSAVIEITDPGGANCQSHYVAGTHAKVLDSDIDAIDPSANPGDTDGPGTEAQFRGIGKPIVDPEGNIFVLDAGNQKLKRIAPDKNRAVTTIASFANDPDVSTLTLFSITYLKGTIYVSGDSITHDILLSVDPTTGAVKDVYREQSHFPQLSSSQLAVITSLEQDGEALLGAGKGYIWRIGTDGTVLAALAGTGPLNTTFPTDFDLTISHPADQWPLFTATSDAEQFLKLHDGKLYWRGAYGVGDSVVRFSCP